MVLISVHFIRPDVIDHHHIHCTCQCLKK